MLTILACRCHGSEPLARKALREAHREDWGMVPIVQGKEACLEYLGSLPKNQETGSLAMYIRSHSSWAVILGQKGDVFRWADANVHDTKTKVDIELVCEHF